VLPSAAVTTTESVVVLPSVSARPPDADPEDTATLFTLMVAPEWDRVGVSVIEATLLATVMVYDVVDAENVGAKVPVLGTIPVRSALLEKGRVTVTV
jgi:hypothetical protein